MSSYWVPAVLASVVLWLIADTIAKRSSVVIGKRSTAAIFLALGIVPMFLYAVVTGELQIQTIPLAISILAGIFLAIGYYTFYKALEIEQLTNSAALVNLQLAIIVIFGLIVLGNPVDDVKMIAILGIFAGSLLITITRGMRFNMMLMPAVIANVSWGIYWVLTIISIGQSQQFIMPLLVARVIGFIAVLLISVKFMASKVPRRSFDKKVRLRMRTVLAPFAGVLDGSGNITFAFAMFTGFVALGSALSAIMPALIGIVAYFVYRERLTPMQGVGLALSIVSAIALSLG